MPIVYSLLTHLVAVRTSCLTSNSDFGRLTKQLDDIDAEIERQQKAL